jgi:DsbC/DsbD-like thiol-disulfide interchange protein
MLRSIFVCGFAGFLVAFVTSTHAGEKSDSKVKVAAKADKIGVDGKQKVTISITVDKNWYIYANPVGAEDFEDNATRVVFLKGKEKLKAKLDYPIGKTKEVGKIRYNIYEGNVIIEATVQRAKGDAGPLTLAVDVNSCSGNTCLAPATVRVSIP